MSSRRVLLVGSPTSSSLSPAIHNAAFAAGELDLTYEAHDVAPDEFAAAFPRLLADRTVTGMNITMPFKERVHSTLDALDADAAATGSVNCVRRRDARTIGHNTDVAGFARALAAAGVGLSGMRCVVLGAGGVARSVVHALDIASAAEVVVVARTPAAAAAVCSVSSIARPGTVSSAPNVDLVVNATPVGMTGRPAEVPFGIADLSGVAAVVDLVSVPATTPLVELAERSGALAVRGTEVLVEQAALSFELWTGTPAPRRLMAAVAAQCTQR